MNLADWIAVTAAIISALGALAAWIANKRTRAVSANGQIGSILIQLNQIFIDEPELRPYFIEGGKLPKGQEQKAKALAAMYLNLLDTVWALEETMDEADRLVWQKYTRHQITSVPIIDQLYRAQREWYANLSQIMDR